MPNPNKFSEPVTLTRPTDGATREVSNPVNMVNAMADGFELGDQPDPRVKASEGQDDTEQVGGATVGVNVGEQGVPLPADTAPRANSRTTPRPAQHVAPPVTTETPPQQ